MKRLLFLILLLTLYRLSATCQNESANYIKSDTTMHISAGHVSYHTLRFSADLPSIFTTLFSLKTEDLGMLTKLYAEFYDPATGGLSDNHAIILVRYAASRLNKDSAIYTKLNPVIISKYESKWTSYLIQRTKILVVMLEYTINSESFKIHNRSSYFSTTLNGVWQILQDTYLKGIPKDADTNKLYAMRFLIFDPKKVHAPSDLSWTVPLADKKSAGKFVIDDQTAFDTVKVTVHEKNHFAFSIGLNGTFINKQNFKLSGDTINVSLDSAQKKQLSNAISISLEYYPFGRDIDRFLPIWKDLKNLKNHFGISVGLSLSKDPLQSYYAGVALCVTKSFNIVGGVNFVNTTKNDQVYNVNNIGSISDLNKYVLKRAYQGSFYIGIALSPSQAIKNLGL